ncbi:MAG TPA: hypothetical protein VNK67_08260 [Burkholderiales bacterium]|nr:hypothetical protein [Burkholderiales bacterium]
MNGRRLACAAALGAALAAPAHADPARPLAEFEARLEALLAPQAWLGGRITEADVALLFAYLRTALLAASQGREAPPPPAELERRALALGRELKLQGVASGLLLLDALEAGAKRMLREALAEPAPGGR